MSYNIESINKWMYEIHEPEAQEAWGRVVQDKACEIRKDHELEMLVFILSRGRDISWGVEMFFQYMNVWRCISI